ncbi:MAG: threonine/serine dehydratase [Gammaproteobacteria bacterium]|nr:threonine/serine dehydratase [Gammaproteobacteria bacterium]
MSAAAGIDDVRSAARRLAGIAVETPLLRHPDLDAAVGGTVLLKLENLQTTGSFKIRGAYNLMSRLTPQQAEAGIVAWSSGNHAQGVAAAGAMLGIRTAVVMPEDAPKAKIARTRRFGGEAILYDRYTGDREVIAKALAAERGAETVPSYDHPHIIAGQGTVGLELMRQAAEMSLVPDQVLIPCSGGGLTAGCAIAIKDASPLTGVHPVEPAGFDDTARSLLSGRREINASSSRSICDALQVATPGNLTFELNRHLLGDGLVVTDAEVRAAMRFAFLNLKLVVEPGGAAALAALLSGKLETRGKITAAIVSGGNVDTELFAEIQAG